MNREVHVRIWERPEVRVLRATRHFDQFPPTSPNGRCRVNQRTFAGTFANGRGAPKNEPARAGGEHVAVGAFLAR